MAETSVLTLFDGDRVEIFPVIVGGRKQWATEIVVSDGRIFEEFFDERDAAVAAMREWALPITFPDQNRDLTPFPSARLDDASE